MQESYQPTEVCKGLWIVPDWCDPPDPTALNIRMAPGLAFGTGATTHRAYIETLAYTSQLVQHLPYCLPVHTQCGITSELRVAGFFGECMNLFNTGSNRQ